MYMNFGVLHAPLPKKILHLASYKILDFTSFLKSKLINIYDFWGCIENWQGNYFLMFFPTDAGDFTCLAWFFSLMWEILHAYRESGRNSVQAGDSLSMRESWKPCVILTEPCKLHDLYTCIDTNELFYAHLNVSLFWDTKFYHLSGVTHNAIHV